MRLGHSQLRTLFKFIERSAAAQSLCLDSAEDRQTLYQLLEDWNFSDESNPALTTAPSLVHTRKRESRDTTSMLVPLPPMNSPIWTMGHTHVGIAHSLCVAFAKLNPANR